MTKRNAFGILKNRKLDALKMQRKLRREWAMTGKVKVRLHTKHTAQ